MAWQAHLFFEWQNRCKKQQPPTGIKAVIMKLSDYVTWKRSPNQSDQQIIALLCFYFRQMPLRCLPSGTGGWLKEEMSSFLVSVTVKEGTVAATVSRRWGKVKQSGTLPPKPLKKKPAEATCVANVRGTDVIVCVSVTQWERCCAWPPAVVT